MIAKQQRQVPQGDLESLGVSDFASMLGIDLPQLSTKCVDAINAADFQYRLLTGLERENVLLRIIRTIDQGHLSVSGKPKLPQWEMGWNENLSDYKKSRDPIDLVPKFVRKNEAVRLRG